MIQFLADAIDQLDLALDQLATGDHNYDRFAMMLVDNALELTLHQHARDSEGRNRLWGAVGKTEVDPKKVKQALGRRFDRKVSLARATGLIDEEMQTSLLNLHSFRNTAYHQGRRHESVLHSLALFYFDCVCRVLGSYRPRYWMSSTADEYSHRAVKYLGNPGLHNAPEQFEGAFSRLAEVSRSIASDLKADLAADLEATIDDFDQALDFIGEGHPTKPTREEALKRAQMTAAHTSDEAYELAEEHGVKPGRPGFAELLLEHYPWPVSADPVPSWRARQVKLGRTENDHAVLAMYCDFMRQTEALRECVTDLAAEVDGYIQHQIDMMLGK